MTPSGHAIGALLAVGWVTVGSQGSAAEHGICLTMPSAPPLEDPWIPSASFRFGTASTLGALEALSLWKWLMVAGGGRRWQAEAGSRLSLGRVPQPVPRNLPGLERSHSRFVQSPHRAKILTLTVGDLFNAPSPPPRLRSTSLQVHPFGLSTAATITLSQLWDAQPDGSRGGQGPCPQPLSHESAV